jgi:hypothetical protein
MKNTEPLNGFEIHFDKSDDADNIKKQKGGYDDEMIFDDYIYTYKMFNQLMNLLHR